VCTLTHVTTTSDCITCSHTRPTGIILTNQVIGPIGAKYLIKYAKEDGQGMHLLYSPFALTGRGIADKCSV
jgi:hypothetical protein